MIPSKPEDQKPKLPIIKDSDEESGEDDKVGFGSDEDIEVLLRKTRFLRHSKSAHADLAPPVKKRPIQLNGYGIQEENEQTSSDSDEEFYVHQSLLPFRKSKSSTTGFSSDLKKEELKTLGTFKASEVLKVIEKQTKEMLKSQENPFPTFVSNSIEYWPPPDGENKKQLKKDPESRRISKAKDSFMGDVMNNGVPMMIPFARTASADSDGQISIKAWSAPDQFTDSEDEEEFGEQRMRSWSASGKLPLKDDVVHFSNKKGISLSVEILDKDGDDEINSWKHHHSFEDADTREPDLASPLSPIFNEDYNISKIEEAEEPYITDDDGSSTSDSSPSPELDSNESLHTPPDSDFGVNLPPSKSDTHLKFYVSDRPKTPICGEQNPRNSTQQIYDPWHSDVEDTSPGPVRSRSCHDTIEAEERVIVHCQMCPSPDCQQFIENERKNSVRVNVEDWNEEEIDKELDSEFRKLKESEGNEDTEKNGFSLQDQKTSFSSQDSGDENGFSSQDQEEPVSPGFSSQDQGINNEFSSQEKEEDICSDQSAHGKLSTQHNEKRTSSDQSLEDEIQPEQENSPRDNEETTVTELLTEDQKSAKKSCFASSFKGLYPGSAKLSKYISSRDQQKSTTSTQDHEEKEKLANSYQGDYTLNPTYDEEDEIPMADDSEIDSPLTPFLARKAPRQRLSPPMASEDEISDVEMTEINSDDEEKAQKHRYNLSGLLIKKSASDYGWGIRKQQIDESVGNLNYWLNEKKKEVTVKRSSTTSAIRGLNDQERKTGLEPVYANIPVSRAAPMDELPTFLTFHQNHRRPQMKKSATSTGFPGSRSSRRILPIRPDFPATPEEPPEYANLPCSVSYHERVSDRLNNFDVSCFFPTTSYNISKEVQHENFAKIQMQMSLENSQVERPVVRREPSFTALTLAEEIENEQRGIPPSTIDPRLALKISGRLEDTSPTSPNTTNSLYNNQEDSSGVSSCCTAPDSLAPTHRVQSTFIPRHDDEVLLEVGDAVHLERQCEDHWCYGTNLRTGQHGIFPVAHVCEIDFVEEICAGALGSNVPSRLPEKKESDTFYLTMLASIEVAHHKGNDVLVQSINKVCQMYQNKEEIIVPQTVLMEISFRGIHIIDKRRKDFFKCPAFDFFYSLQNISFCGAHPKQLRYFGFITKHPLLPRFACHVFLSNESTQPIVESIGRAFKRSYDEYMAFAHQTVDEYLE
ncbi:hypothetical protein FO519_005154 [Halicephalobus sp. NKZ332]|nr:hypothetical protein FO519_005154 [Halicephalobus sp. NKZ332]